MDPADADDLLAGLDDDQREAVTTPSLPLCVLAGAGSGKTRVLTRRIAWRCATGLDDSRRVLALTFTRSAAVELATRLRALGRRDPIRTGTFHAVAWAELRARAAEGGRTAPVLLDRPARLLARVADLDRGSLNAAVTELAWTRARCVPLDRYPAEARRAGRSPAIDAERVVTLGQAYEREKRKRGVVDFDDLLEQLTAALAHDPAFAAAQRWRFAHLYVDEFQDVNPLQHRLLEEWRGGRDAFTAVGDPNQSIYGWNGSDPSFIEQFTDLYPGASVVAIDCNYRSTSPILEIANGLLDAGGLGGVRLRSFRGEGPPPDVAGFASDDDEAMAVARAVIDAKIPGTTWGQQAVLARTNALLEPVEAALAAVGVPVRVRGRQAFHELPVVRAALRELSAAGARFAATVAHLAGRLPEVDSLPAGSGGGPGASDGPGTGEEGRLDDEQAALARLVELAERYIREQPHPEAAGFRGWLLGEVETLPDGDGVDLATFHAAKGREWPTVHIVGAEEGFVPISWAQTPEAVAEERRLFYVACTRAEQRLRITWAASRRFGDRDPVERRRSPYLDELSDILERMRRELEPSRPATLLRPAPPPPSAHEARAEALRRWRARRSRAAGIAPGALLPDAVLAAVAGHAPTDAESLAAIPGTRALVLAGFTDEVLESLRG